MWFNAWAKFWQTQIVVIHVLGLVNAVHAAIRVRNPPAAIGWALALFTFPYVAVPLYWVFGRAKFIGYRKARRGGDSPLDLAARLVSAELAQFNLTHATPTGARLPGCAQMSELPAAPGNDIKLLIDGRDGFAAIFDAIRGAKSYILVQFFIVREDRLGLEFQEALINKARDGVRVYFLIDEVGSHALSRAYVEALRMAGVQTNFFRTTRGRGNRLQINFRNHRKLVVCDGVVAVTGGSNVGVEYLGESKRFGPWRDTHVEARGPAVQALQFPFVEDWHWATGNVPELNWVPRSSGTDNRVAQVLATGPADDLDMCSLAFLDAVNRAQERLWIASPYFVPDPAVLAALQLAAVRGVDVRIMLPSKPDHYLPYLSSFSYYDTLARAGIRLYRYEAGFLHQKVMLVDEIMASVGSINVDYRSFHLNFELALLVTDASFAREVAAMLEADFARCRLVDYMDYRRLSIPFRLAVRLARLLSPIQ